MLPLPRLPEQPGTAFPLLPDHPGWIGKEYNQAAGIIKGTNPRFGPQMPL